MMPFIKRWIITTVAVLVAAEIVPGIQYDTLTGLLVATLVLGLLNAVVRPILVVLSLPLLILSLGLFLIVINSLLLWAVGHMKTFHVENFFPSAVLGSIIISLVTLVLNTLTDNKDSRIQVRRRRPRKPDRGGGGPVIDV